MQTGDFLVGLPSITSPDLNFGSKRQRPEIRGIFYSGSQKSYYLIWISACDALSASPAQERWELFVFGSVTHRVQALENTMGFWFWAFIMNLSRFFGFGPLTQFVWFNLPFLLAWSVWTIQFQAISLLSKLRFSLLHTRRTRKERRTIKLNE